MTTNIHSVYSLIAKESPASRTAFALDGHLFTYAQIERELATQSAVGVAYATAVITQLLQFIANRDVEHGQAIAATIRVDVSPRLCAIEQYQSMPESLLARRTMSGDWTNSQMIAKLETSEHDALVYFTDLLRICRDVIARKAVQPPNDAPVDSPSPF